jgi:hypothetical protein
MKRNFAQRILLVLVLAFPVLLTACGISDVDQLSTAVAKLETENALAVTATTLPTQAPTEEAGSAEFANYVTEFEARFGAVEETYASVTVLYELGDADHSLFANETWRTNMNAALDALDADATHLSGIVPIPPEFLELDQLMGALSTAAYFFGLQYRDGMNSLDAATLQEANARYEGVRSLMDEGLVLFEQATSDR